MKDFNFKYFLSANSAEGFVSVFGESYSAEEGWRCFIIKGGPGTGKSSFMKYVAYAAAKTNNEVQLCPCTGDPDSLDAIILPEKKIIVLDGTSPHVVEPLYPAVCEEILNFGTFWDTEKIKPFSKEIIALTNSNKLLHKTASKYLVAAGELYRESIRTALLCTDLKKVTGFAEKLCKKHIPKKNNTKGSEKTVFLNAVTPKGVISFANTIPLIAENLIITEDRFGAVSGEICKIVKNYAVNCGYNVISVKNCLLPHSVTDHVIIPQLNLAFLREYDFQRFETHKRKIHARRFMDVKTLCENREKLKFNQKVTKELLLEGITALSNAKTVHDKLEKYYANAMDFKSLTLFAKDFCRKILK